MQTASQRRQAFDVWLRTGRASPPAAGGQLEYKFNSWHDLKDGRFTFVGSGQYIGTGTSRKTEGRSRKRSEVSYAESTALPAISSLAEVEAWRAEQLAKRGNRQGYPEAIEAQYRRYLQKLARKPGDVGDSSARLARPHTKFDQRESPRAGQSVDGEFRGGGGDYGGGGADGSWENRPQADQATGLTGAVQHQAHKTEPHQWRQVSRNGYLYEIDSKERTRRVSGVLMLKPDQIRSRKSQRAAGGGERRKSDEGGHYIARRFNGPTESFNHFAQNNNFNRSEYRKLEEEWARAKRAGKSVRVKIVPVYDGASKRPSALNIWFWIDGILKSHKLPNEAKETKSAR